MAKDLRREAGRIKHMVKQEQRYCKIQEDFVLTDLFRRPITEKFYSRATQISETDSLAKLVEKHLITIKEVNTKSPRERLAHTIIESQEYGWNLDHIEHLDRSDRRFYKPHVTTEMVKIATATSDAKHMKRDQFTGVPFKVW